MVNERKKKIIDGMDREILRALYKNRRRLSGNEIANKVNLSSSAIRPRLDNLLSKGIVKKQEVQKDRIFKRKFGNTTKTIKAPRSIFWKLDIKT